MGRHIETEEDYHVVQRRGKVSIEYMKPELMSSFSSTISISYEGPI